MKVFKEIDIATPIWKTRSVGLNVSDVPMAQYVKVTISYKKKDGKLAYPGEYVINADDVRKYPAMKIRGGMYVHDVPIKDLANLNLTINSNQLKTQNMLFGSNELSKIIKESADAAAGNFENKAFLEAGKHVMTMIDITLEYAKSDNNPMLVAVFEKDEDHKPIKEFMKLAGPNTDIPREKLVKLFHRGFNYEIQACNTEADLLNQLKKYIGKKLAVAVKGVKKAYAFRDKEGNDIVMEQTYPEYWYCGTQAEIDDMYIDMSKAIKPLSSEDKEKLVAFAEINGGPYVPKSKNKEEKVEEEKNIEPKKIEEVPAKKEKPKAKKEEPKPEIKEEPESEPESEPEEEETPPSNDTEDDDDFPF